MANKDDNYLIYYREFFENFARTVNPNDQLPVNLANYKLINSEVVGGVIDWTTQYLNQKKCPQSLVPTLIQIVIEETRKACKKQPISCGFNPSDNAYEPLKLMQTVMAKANEVCLRYLDNSMLCSLPPPGPPYFATSVCASKNRRRRMEDRHVVVNDLNVMFDLQEASPSSYYAIFDGHAGSDAAAYCCAHLHQFLAESKYFVNDPERALLDAFSKADRLFLDKCKVECFNSGTTVVCALFKPKEKMLYIAWVGDSQALLVNRGSIMQCVLPHKPCRVDEKERIEKHGGQVIYWGTWRINGQLAVSRAIGDADYKPFVSAVPDIKSIPLDGGEDFLILACDGLWDVLSEDEAAIAVYNMVQQNPDNIERISERLVQQAKVKGSTDNISVIVVFLREPSAIQADAHWANRNGSPPTTVNTMDTSVDNANVPFAIADNGTTTTPYQNNDGLVLNLTENFKKQNGDDKQRLLQVDDDDDGFPYTKTEKTNGKRLASEFDDDEDMGPETAVDGVDDCVPLPVEDDEDDDEEEDDDDDEDSQDEDTKERVEKMINNNANPFCSNGFEKDDEAETFQKDDESKERDETPTPPADVVHDEGIAEATADSGEESEDEWNYIKGEEANKENISPEKEKDIATDIPEEEDEEDINDAMSQLNPNAAEFIPVSPTRSIPSPACRMLINDEVLAQSPKKPTEVDIKVPLLQDFEKEVKSRPSEIEVCGNGFDNSEYKSPSKELMENLLNGKSLDEIPVFQPSNMSAAKVTTDEFHFGPNASPFAPSKIFDQTEDIGDGVEPVVQTEDTSVVDFVQINETKQDPMSTSFYQDNEQSDTNPFDLNKVQVLPENLDEFLSKPETVAGENIQLSNDVITDLPEHEPLGDKIVVEDVEPSISSDVVKDNDEVLLYDNDRVQVTDLDKYNDEDDEKERASPDTEEVSEVSKVIESESSAKLDDENVELKETSTDIEVPKEIAIDDVSLIETEDKEEEIPSALSPKPCDIPETPSILSPETCDLPEFPKSESPSQFEHVEESTASPVPSPQFEHVEECIASPLPSPQFEHVEESIASPVQSQQFEHVETSASPIPSPQPEPVEQNLIDVDETVVIESKIEETVEDLCPISPRPAQLDLCAFEHEINSVKDDLNGETKTAHSLPDLQSPIVENELKIPGDEYTNLTRSPELENLNEISASEHTKPIFDDLIEQDEKVDNERVIDEKELVEEDEVKVQEEVKIDEVIPTVQTTDLLVDHLPSQDDKPELITSSPTNLNAIPDVCLETMSKSGVSEIESVATTDVNSFLDRTPVCEIASPLSVTPNEQPKIEEEKTELIEEKHVEEAIKVPEIVEEKVAEPVPIDAVGTAAAVTAVAAAAAAGTASIVANKKPTTPKLKSTPTTTKKPATTPKSDTKTTISPTKARQPLSRTTATTARTGTTTKTSTTSTTSSRLISQPKTSITSKTTLSKTTTAPTSATTRSTTLRRSLGSTSSAKSPSVTSTDKKPLMNGDLKTGTKLPAARKSTDVRAFPTKTSPTKSLASRTSTIGTSARTTSTRTATVSTASPSATTSSSTTAKPRTTTLTSKPSATRTNLAPTKTSSAKLTSPKSTSATLPKRPATAPLKPRVALKPTTDKEKQIKDNTNKLLSTSRTTTSTKSGISATGRTAVSKVESKTSRSTFTKTTTSTLRSTVTKKAATATVKSTSVVTNPTKIEKPIQNGVPATVITEQITTTVTNTINTDQLVKDNSPIDNKLIENILDEPIPIAD